MSYEEQKSKPPDCASLLDQVPTCTEPSNFRGFLGSLWQSDGEPHALYETRGHIKAMSSASPDAAKASCMMVPDVAVVPVSPMLVAPPPPQPATSINGANELCLFLAQSAAAKAAATLDQPQWDASCAFDVSEANSSISTTSVQSQMAHEVTMMVPASTECTGGILQSAVIAQDWTQLVEMMSSFPANVVAAAAVAAHGSSVVKDGGRNMTIVASHQQQQQQSLAATMPWEAVLAAAQATTPTTARTAQFSATRRSIAAAATVIATTTTTTANTAAAAATPTTTANSSNTKNNQCPLCDLVFHRPHGRSCCDAVTRHINTNCPVLGPKTVGKRERILKLRSLPETVNKPVLPYCEHCARIFPSSASLEHHHRRYKDHKKTARKSIGSDAPWRN